MCRSLQRHSCIAVGGIIYLCVLTLFKLVVLICFLPSFLHVVGSSSLSSLLLYLYIKARFNAYLIQVKSKPALRLKQECLERDLHHLIGKNIRLDEAFTRQMHVVFSYFDWKMSA